MKKVCVLLDPGHVRQTPGKHSPDGRLLEYQYTREILFRIQEELMKLEGVGENIAQRIIEYREKTRLFETIQDVMQVKGFGEILFEDNKHLLTVK